MTISHSLAQTNDGGNFNEARVEDAVGAYWTKYRPYMEAYEQGSIVRQAGGVVSNFELMALGQQLDQYNNYRNYCESTQNLGALGVIPAVAADVITASVGNSIIPLLCSIQPMREEHDIVYYKQIKVQQAGGGYNSGDVISDPLTRDNPGDGTLGGQRLSNTLATTTNGTVAYNGNLPRSGAAPIRPFTIKLNIGTAHFGQDDGAGNILGFGVQGTINYATGAVALELATDPLATNLDINFIYDLDLDSATSLPKIQGSLITRDVRAEVFALAADTGHMANFNFQNRFGRSGVDETAADLSNEVTRTLNSAVIRRMIAGAEARSVATPNSDLVTWSSTAPTNVSYAEHKMTFVDAVSNAERNLHVRSGSNSINRYIVGSLAAARMRAMPEFVMAPAASEVSIGLYGTYDGVPVVRATGVVGDNDIFCVSNPQGYFNAPMAYSPYMPLFITNTVQSPNNPLQGTTAAAIWSGMTPLNDGLVTKMVITALNLNP